MGHGIGDILGGAILIGIGLTMGGSVFTGNPTLFDWLFDGLGVFWIGRGVLEMVGSRGESLAGE